jgi:hypothetical protein
MNVKAQGLINGAKWIELTHGQPALARVLRSCSPAVRDRYISATAMVWHPMDELIEFVTVADRLLGRDDGNLAEEIGAAGARANMKTMMMRVIVYFTRPEFLMRRVAGTWSQFNDEGTMELVAFESRRLVVRLSGCGDLPRIFVRILTGWAREIAAAVAAGDPVARVTEHNQGAVVWELTWTRSLAEVVSREDHPVDDSPR